MKTLEKQLIEAREIANSFEKQAKEERARNAEARALLERTRDLFGPGGTDSPLLHDILSYLS